jgi:alpha-D-xyloside xylohydrolase
MLGPDIRVAPVFTATGEVDFYLPDGTWTNLLTGEAVTVFAENGRSAEFTLAWNGNSIEAHSAHDQPWSLRFAGRQVASADGRARIGVDAAEAR